jgi:hypothetical protein
LLNGLAVQLQIIYLGGQKPAWSVHARPLDKNMALLVSIYNFFFEIFFGCSHNSLTRPFTLQARSYKVCLDCGRQFPYSLEKMRVLHPWEVRKPQPIVLEPAFASAASEVREDYSPTKAIA